MINQENSANAHLKSDEIKRKSSTESATKKSKETGGKEKATTAEIENSADKVSNQDTSQEIAEDGSENEESEDMMVEDAYGKTDNVINKEKCANEDSIYSDKNDNGDFASSTKKRKETGGKEKEGLVSASVTKTGGKEKEITKIVGGSLKSAYAHVQSDGEVSDESVPDDDEIYSAKYAKRTWVPEKIRRPNNTASARRKERETGGKEKGTKKIENGNVKESANAKRKKRKQQVGMSKK